MPDLNYNSEAIEKGDIQIAKFWLLKGVDGIPSWTRLVFFTRSVPGQVRTARRDTPQTIQFWVDLKAYMRTIKPDSMLVGEVWVGSEIQSTYYRNGKGLDLVFDFEFAD
jgi:hypothetical protein